MYKLCMIGAIAAATSLAPNGAQALDAPLTAGALDKKLARAQERLAALQAKPTKAIPAAILREARGIVLLRSLKVGLGIGAETGGGVAMVKTAGSGAWSPPAFVRAAEASWGAQIGAQDTDIFIVLMSEKSLGFLKPGGSAGAGFEAQAVAGPVDVGAEFDTDSLKSSVLVYADSSGAFAGATVKAGAIVGAPLRNRVYHGASMQEVLFAGKGRTTEQTKALTAVIQRYAGVEARASR